MIHGTTAKASPKISSATFTSILPKGGVIGDSGGPLRESFHVSF
jgi:hypothetical protein